MVNPDGSLAGALTRAARSPGGSPRAPSPAVTTRAGSRCCTRRPGKARRPCRGQTWRPIHAWSGCWPSRRLRARRRDRLRAGRRCRARRVAGLRHGGLRRVADGCRCRPAALSALRSGVRHRRPAVAAAFLGRRVRPCGRGVHPAGAHRRGAAHGLRADRQLVAPGGRLLVIAGARDEHDDPGKMPWPLTRAEIGSFREHGLSEHSIADVLDEEEDRGLVRRWLAWFTRTEASRPSRAAGEGG